MIPGTVKPPLKPAEIRLGSTITVIALLVAGLFGVDRFLARVESAEIKNSAQRAYLRGTNLRGEGRTDSAVDALREAHALERDNPEYEIELIDALVAAGKSAQAKPLLDDILAREPNDGRANLIAARLMVRLGDIAGAQAYFHRAIYGEWPRDAEMHRVAAHEELIGLLAARKQKQELLAELISLEAEASPGPKLQKKLGQLFMVADAPGRAAALYTVLVEKDPSDIQAWEGLGDADLQLGQYRAAHDAYLRGFLREPNNASVRAHLQLLNSVTELDPTQRKLTSIEKYRRSVRILEMATTALATCLGAKPAPGADAELLRTAETTLKGKTPVHVTNEAAESVLSLAERLWHAGTTCDDGEEPMPNPLALIMKKIASQGAS
jgi:tetratricopeptide (TPR) repeat protein